jgi:PAS domain S-box-containing protein
VTPDPERDTSRSPPSTSTPVPERFDGMPRSRFTLRAIRSGLIAMNLLVVLVCGLMLDRAWRREISDAESDAVAAARLLERATSATFDKVSIALNGVAGQLERQLAERGVDPSGLWQLLDGPVSQVPELERVGVFDAAGQQVCGVPLERCRHFNIGDRDYFAMLRDYPDRPPALFGPYGARPTNEPGLILARALRTPDKAFAGVIVAVFPLSRLQPLVAAAQFGPNGVASLRSASMQPLARASRVASTTDAAPSAAISDRLRQELARSPESGVYRAVTASDGIDRVTAYRKLPAHPVYVLVGEATEDFLGAWWRMAGWTGGLLFLILGASLAVERIARTSLRENERAQRLYDEAPCAYHTLDAQGRYLSINATELQWLGCTRDEVVGKMSPVDFLTEEGRATFARCFPELQQSGRLDELPLDLVGRQGTARRVLVSAKAVADAQGRFQLSNSVMHDISALHRAQEQVRETSRLQALMLDTELVGMARLKGSQVIWANRGMDRIFGYSGTEWQGMPARQLHVDDQTYESLTRTAYPELQAGRAYRAQLQLRRKDRSPCWMDVGAAPLEPGEDEVMLLVADISAQKDAEAARLREVELRALNEQLLETGRLKDEFLSNMSHELRTPLNAVIGFSQLLQLSPAIADSPKHAKYVRQIGDSGQHLLSLVQTMLDFAKSTSGRMFFTTAPLVVQDALDEVVDMLAPKALAAKVDFAVSVAPDLDSVVNDPLRLRQMLLNLVGNAVKFSKPGGLVSLRARGIDTERWCIEVEDHGIGIREDDLQRLFTRFVQLSAGSTKAYGGMGLGLALVQQIASAQGGEVQVRSQPDVGSVFTLVLPRHLAASSPASPLAPGAVT